MLVRPGRVGQIGRTRASGGTPTPTPESGVTATSFTTTEQAHFHPHSQAGVVTKSGSEIVACPDLKGLAALTATSGTAPVEMTDALGRKFWRCEGAQFAQIAAAFAANTRGVSAIMVGRWHKNAGSALSCGINGASPPATSTGLLATYSTSGNPYVHRPLGILSTTDATNKKYMPIGNQLQVIAVRAGTTALGGQRCYVNNRVAVCSQASVSAAFTGMEIGRYASSGGSYGAFDLYELALWNTGLASATMDAAVAEAVAHWGIAEITATLVLEGDSRIHGTNSDVTTGTALGMVLSAPGAGHVPANVRVLNMATSGGQIPDIITRRDAANSIFDSAMDIGGEKHVAYIIGANDGAPSGDANYAGTTFNTTQRGDAITAAEKAMIRNGTTGFLDRGWTVHRMVEPMVKASPSVSIAQQRVGIRAADFLTDCLAAPGQTYDGKLLRHELALISVGGATPFNTTADVGSPYTDGDGVHPTILGVQLYASGGDTPAYGFGAVV